MSQSLHHPAAHGHHGNSIAAWSAVLMIMLGSLLGCVAALIASVPFAVAGAVVIVLGGVTGKVLTAMGFGASGRPGA